MFCHHHVDGVAEHLKEGYALTGNADHQMTHMQGLLSTLRDENIHRYSHTHGIDTQTFTRNLEQRALRNEKLAQTLAGSLLYEDIKGIAQVESSHADWLRKISR